MYGTGAKPRINYASAPHRFGTTRRAAKLSPTCGSWISRSTATPPVLPSVHAVDARGGVRPAGAARRHAPYRRRLRRRVHPGDRRRDPRQGLRRRFDIHTSTASSGINGARILVTSRAAAFGPLASTMPTLNSTSARCTGTRWWSPTDVRSPPLAAKGNIPPCAASMLLAYRADPGTILPFTDLVGIRRGFRQRTDRRVPGATYALADGDTDGTIQPQPDRRAQLAQMPRTYSTNHRRQHPFAAHDAAQQHHGPRPASGNGRNASILHPVFLNDYLWVSN